MVEVLAQADSKEPAAVERVLKAGGGERAGVGVTDGEEKASGEGESDGKRKAKATALATIIVHRPGNNAAYRSKKKARYRIPWG